MRPILAVFACLLLAGAAQAGRLSGIVHGLNAASPDQASINPYPASLGAVAQDSDARQEIVGFVYLASLRDSDQRSAPALRQHHQQFVPRLLAVPSGREVAFPNDDPVLHNVFSYSKTKRFDLGRYGKGKSKSVRFDKAGVVRVFCDVHSNMSATVLVVDSDYIAPLEMDGSFELNDVPDGQHELVVWQNEGPERRQPVRVSGPETRVEIGR